MAKSDFPPLTVHPLHAGIKPCVMHVGKEILRSDSPALEGMTDFMQTRLVTCSPKLQIDDATANMKLMQVRCLVVVDDHNTIIGLINARDIQGRKPIEYAQENRIKHSEITVEMIMTPQSKLSIVKLGQLSNAQIGHVVETMKQLNTPYLLVVEQSDEQDQPTLRGLFSIAHISRLLDEDINVLLGEAHSLLDLTQSKD